MLDGTDPALLLEWMEFNHLEPFGEERADLRIAILCLLISQALGNKKAKLDDFMPKFERPEKQKFNHKHFREMMKRQYGRKINRNSRG